MKRFFPFFLLCASAFAQTAARVDIPLLTAGPNVPLTGGALPQALWVANSTVYLCTHPSATLGACQASLISTFTDSTEGTTCPSATQLVQLPGNICTESTGAAANIGAWVANTSLPFDYWVVSTYGTYGPFTFYPPTGSSIGCATTGCTYTGGINAPYINGVVQADQQAGADFCVKLRAANVWALAHGYSIVDATHFPSSVTCSVDPLHGLAAESVNISLTDLFPASRIATSIAWIVNNSGLKIIGMGNAVTWLDGASIPATAACVFCVNAGTTGVDQFQMRDMSVLGGSANVADTIQTYRTNHSTWDHVSTWGASGCGIDFTNITVTTRLDSFRTSVNDAATFGWLSGRTVPAHDECLNGANGGTNPVQDYVSINPAGEGTTGDVLFVADGKVMTWVSGTFEQSASGNGASFDSASQYATFIDTDIEANALWGISDASVTGVTLVNPFFNGNTSGSITSAIGPNQMTYNNMGGPYLNATFLLTAAAANINGQLNVTSPNANSLVLSGANTSSIGFEINNTSSTHNWTFGVGGSSFSVPPCIGGFLIFDNTGSQLGACLDTGYYFSAKTGFKINGSAAVAGHYLRGNSAGYVDGAIQAGDLPTSIPVATATQTAGQVVCIKTTGPPPTYGTCTALTAGTGVCSVCN